MRYSYKVLTKEISSSEQETDLLNDYGKAGWELVETVMFAKRWAVVGTDMHPPTVKMVYYFKKLEG